LSGERGRPLLGRHQRPAHNQIVGGEIHEVRPAVAQQAQECAVDVDDVPGVVQQKHRVAGVPEGGLEESGPSVGVHPAIVTL
jgi:hypothetical protein